MKRIALAIVVAAFALFGASFGAQAQNSWATPGGSVADGKVEMCLNSSNQAVPVSSGQCASTSPISFPSISTSACSALCSSLAVDAAAGSLYSFNVSADSTLSAAAWWIMIYNAASAPSDGGVTPNKCYAMASGTTSFSAAFPTPVPLGGTGITIGVSTTGCFTKTASTHAFISGDYK